MSLQVIYILDLFVYIVKMYKNLWLVLVVVTSLLSIDYLFFYDR